MQVSKMHIYNNDDIQEGKNKRYESVNKTNNNPYLYLLFSKLNLMPHKPNNNLQVGVFFWFYFVTNPTLFFIFNLSYCVHVIFFSILTTIVLLCTCHLFEYFDHHI